MSAPLPDRKYVSDFKPGEVLRDYTEPDSGLRLLVTRGYFSFCAYVGVKADHSLAGLADFTFPCHWGVNFATWGSADSIWPEGWFWWGWDYGHAYDAQDFLANLPADVPESLRVLFQEHQARLGRSVEGLPPVKNWTVEEVLLDGLDVVVSLKEELERSELYAGLLSYR